MPFTPTDYLPYDFANRRHIGPSPSEMEEMFKTIGICVSRLQKTKLLQV